MATSATVTTEGRQALIEYLRNSTLDSQTDKIRLKKFKLMFNESSAATQTKLLSELNQKLIIGRNASSGTLDTPATFSITSKTNITGNKLRLTMAVPIAFSTGDNASNNISAVAIVFDTNDTNDITAVSTSAKTFTIAGDYSDKYSSNSVFDVIDSTGNDAEYTIVSVSYSGGNTIIVVNEVIASATVDGEISKLYLMAYTVYEEAFNKASNSDATILTDIQF